MRTPESVKFALIAAAITAAALALPAAALAEPSGLQFLSPTGNIGCDMATRDDGTAYAWCKIADHKWTAPESGGCEIAYIPGSIGQPDAKVALSQGRAPCLGAVMSQLFLTGEYAPPVLDYGQSKTIGAITCVSASDGVTCTDTSTNHFFRISEESYQLG
jgi:hypothetical protein